MLATFLPLVTRDRPRRERAQLAGFTLTRGRRFAVAYTTAACEVGRDAARRLRLPDEVQRSVDHAYEWWNGQGVPDGLAGEDLPVGARVAPLTAVAVLFDTVGGVELAVDAVRRRSGGVLDPAIADHFTSRAGARLGQVDATDPWELMLSGEPHEWEQVRLHPYHSERILAGSERLASLGPLVGGHHERCDGSGYHRGSTGHDVPLPARLLAAADAYQAMTRPRPHRPAREPDRAAAQLSDDARAGLLDAEAVGAVLAGAGHTTAIRRVNPAGLPPREVEVLDLVAQGCTNPEVAQHLVISRRTAEQHVQNVYRKIGVSSRAAAALFAMEHGLLSQEDQ